ncbi:HSF-type DNA-binding-domain-containing protein [Mycena maculata]|uniref:Transcription factor n=1 Tax=Mycena maculata TaxID=230809 RepID=A0AAD7NAV0_9AGAR|nr:HSF-type DNA-binding-domain-containing protein [Mycena maculata]
MSASTEDSMSSTITDFVKKLYTMLEDETFQDWVSWGPQGDCFIVKDMNEFAKSALPRLFKHSNFASFVRQLNKYNFHKVKLDDDQIGEKSWTFWHPDFHANCRDTLENIKRKVPGQRKSAPSHLPLTSSSSLAATSDSVTLEAQLMSLGAAHTEAIFHVQTLERKYQEVLLEMVTFQRSLAQQDGLMQNLIQYFLRENWNRAASLQGDGVEPQSNPFLFIDTQETQQMLNKSFPEIDVARSSLVQMSELSRRAEAMGMSFAAGGSSSAVSSKLGQGGEIEATGIIGEMSGMDMLARIEQLQCTARNTPLDVSANFDSSNNNSPLNDSETSVGRELQTLNADEIVVPTPANLVNFDPALVPSSDGWSTVGGDTHAGLEVYTIGHLMPCESGLTDAPENWSFDGNVVGAQDSALGLARTGTSTGSEPSSRSTLAQTLRVWRSTFVPGWAVPPRVLLVDDDAVTRKLSSKFLQVFGCTTDVAVDGVGAVDKMNFEKYDLVLMDIVMPKLDGVSATSMIRKFDPQTPIISMTSSSRPSEIITYYSSGMNNILPKPFTKEGLFDMLEKHLTHLRVIQHQMRIGRPPTGVPPLNDAGFESTLYAGAASSVENAVMAYGPGDSDAGINVLAGMGLTDELYNSMLMTIVNGDAFNLASGKRARDPDDQALDGNGGKRGRFEVIQ